MSKTATASRPSSLTLATLSAGALVYGDEEAAPPTRLVVLPWGRNPSRRGEFVVDELTASVFASNQQRHRIDGRVALDFEHNTLEGTPAYESSSEPRPIAAWALCRVIPQEGLVYEDIQWTPDGLSAWQRRLYQDLSPAPVRGKDGRTVIALHSTALCRHGELEGLTIAHAAAPKGLAAYFDALSAGMDLQDAADGVRALFSFPLHPPMKDTLVSLLALLGVNLAADADEAATATALDTGLEALKKLKEKPAEAAAKPDALSADVTALRAEMDALRKETLISEATREGKVIPLSSEGIKATPLSALQEIVKAAKPGEVKTQKQTQAGQEPGLEGKPEPLSAEAIEIMKSCGLTDEEIAAKNPGAQKAAS